VDEDTLERVVNVLVLLVEAAGAFVIFAGAAYSFLRFIGVAAVTRKVEALVPVRLGLGRLLALGLEFQLAGDLLRTAVAPSFEAIGKLAAVAAIRTALNFFLAQEIKTERAEIESVRSDGAGPDR
jgi:uncharacterized membrane protein